MNTLKHLACIMDGNRRWAHARGLPGVMGHRQGLETVAMMVDFCLEQGISYLSLFVFSQENMRRSIEEKQYLYMTITRQAGRMIQDALKKKIKVRFVGDRTLFPDDVRTAIDTIEDRTRAGDRLQVDLLFCYSGQQEIAHAMQEVAHMVERREITLQDITHTTIERFLWSFPTPAPDLIIRTGGFSRLSGFLLYHAAYAELRFLDCLWPDLRKEEVQKVVDDFRQCARNFGS